MWIKKTMATISLIAGTTASFAGVTTLDFEDFSFLNPGSLEQVSSFYKNKYGIDFNANAWAALSTRADLDDNGQPDGIGVGNFYGGGNVAITLFDAAFPEDTISSSFLINIEGGFGSNLLMSFATLNAGGTVNIYSGLNGSGRKLGSGSLSGMLQDGCDPLYMCDWAAQSLDFDGIAYSVEITGITGRLLIDEIRFSDTTTQPPTGVPEPASLALVAAGLGSALLGRRRSQRA
jgi:hypothetical protein